MAYIERSLGRSEILLHRAWSAMIVFLSLSAAAYAYELRWLAAVAALAGLALFLVFMVPVWSTEIGVTKQRFIFKTGLLRWSSDELLNYGRIEVRGTVWPTSGCRRWTIRLRCARRFSKRWTIVTDQAPPAAECRQVRWPYRAACAIVKVTCVEHGY
jgi:hypothetical protein